VPCKRLIAIFAAVMSLLSLSSFAHTQKWDEDEFIHKHQFDLVKINCERIEDYAITRVFLNPVYHVTVNIKDGNGPGPTWSNLVATRVGEELTPIPRPMRDGDVTSLLPMFKPDFQLTSGDVAETVQRALDLIFPGNADRWNERFLHDGNQWTFVRARPSGSSMGPEEFILTTDDKGAITGVRYVRNASTP
jgi:hypothetical protein